MNVNDFNGWAKGDEDGKAVANFAATFSQWAKIDRESVQLTDSRSLADMLAEVKMNFVPMKAEDGYYNPVTNVWVKTGDVKIYNPLAGNIVSSRTFTPDYNPMGYSELLNSAFGAMVAEGNQPTRILHWGGGRKIFVQFIPRDGGIFNAAGREHMMYLGLSSSLDGSTVTSLGMTSYTPICSNTYAAARRELSESGGNVRRTKNMTVRITSIAQSLGILRTLAEEFFGTLNRLAQVEVSQDIANAFFEHMLPLKTRAEGERENSGPLNRRAELQTAIVETVREQAASKVTAYDLFAGTTRYIGNRTQKRDVFGQYEYVTEGAGSQFSDKAYSFAVGLLGG